MTATGSYTEVFNGGADAANVTTGNSVFTSMLGTTTPTFRTTGPGPLGRSMRCASTGYGRTTHSAFNYGFFRFYFRMLGGALAGTRSIFSLSTAGGAQVLVQARSDRKFGLFTDAGGVTSTHALTVGDWCRIEIFSDIANNLLEYRLFNVNGEGNPHTLTASQILPGSGGDNGAVAWDRFQLGLQTADVSGNTPEFAEFKVSGTDWLGPAMLVPGAPTSLTLGLADFESQALSWTAPASDGGSAITDYVVQVAEAGSGDWDTFADGTSTTPAATITGLDAGTEYDYRVAATNSLGTGAWSSTATGFTEEEASSGLIIVQSPYRRRNPSRRP